MTRFLSATVMLVATLIAATFVPIQVNGQESPLASPVGLTGNCPVTQPNGRHVPDHPIDPGGYGNHALWTNLYMWSRNESIVRVPDDQHILPDGTIREMKWAWYRFVPGKLTIEGRRLDAPDAPLEAWIPDGYGDSGFQVIGLTFPSAGCWEITGRVGNEHLTFITLVVTPSTWEPKPTPTP